MIDEHFVTFRAFLGISKPANPDSGTAFLQGEFESQAQTPVDHAVDRESCRE